MLKQFWGSFREEQLWLYEQNLFPTLCLWNPEALDSGSGPMAALLMCEQQAGQDASSLSPDIAPLGHLETKQGG